VIPKLVALLRSQSSEVLADFLLIGAMLDMPTRHAALLRETFRLRSRQEQAVYDEISADSMYLASLPTVSQLPKPLCFK
jgi:hypothetical protein